MAKGSRLPCKEGVRVGVIPRACTFLSLGTGEPDTSKVVCPVRGGPGEKAVMTSLAVYPTSVRRVSGMEACGNTSGLQVLDAPLE